MHHSTAPGPKRALINGSSHRFVHNAAGHIVGSECASGEGDTENLSTVRAETDIMPLDQRPLFSVHMDLAQFLLTVRAHRGLVRLDDLDFRHIDHVLLTRRVPLDPVRSVCSGPGQAAALKEKVVGQLLQPYAVAAGVPGIAPHDCRRSCAKMCRAAGGELEQIQLLLGHASVQTTERYLGTKQDLVHAPNDGIKLRVAV